MNRWSSPLARSHPAGISRAIRSDGWQEQAPALRVTFPFAFTVNERQTRVRGVWEDPSAQDKLIAGRPPGAA